MEFIGGRFAHASPVVTRARHIHRPRGRAHRYLLGTENPLVYLCLRDRRRRCNGIPRTTFRYMRSEPLQQLVSVERLLSRSVLWLQGCNVCARNQSLSAHVKTHVPSTSQKTRDILKVPKRRKYRASTARRLSTIGRDQSILSWTTTAISLQSPPSHIVKISVNMS